jgi:hypothetical protein
VQYHGDTFGDMYFQFRNITPYQPPVFLIESFARLALHLYNATQLLVPAELEEMLNYSLEWSEIAPHTLLISFLLLLKPIMITTIVENLSLYSADAEKS